MAEKKKPLILLVPDQVCVPGTQATQGRFDLWPDLRVKTIGIMEGDDFLPDAPNKKPEWKLWAPGAWLLDGLSLAE